MKSGQELMKLCDEMIKFIEDTNNNSGQPPLTDREKNAYRLGFNAGVIVGSEYGIQSITGIKTGHDMSMTFPEGSMP